MCAVEAAECESVASDVVQQPAGAVEVAPTPAPPAEAPAPQKEKVSRKAAAAVEAPSTPVRPTKRHKAAATAKQATAASRQAANKKTVRCRATNEQSVSDRQVLLKTLAGYPRLDVHWVETDEFFPATVVGDVPVGVKVKYEIDGSRETIDLSRQEEFDRLVAAK